MPKVSEVCRHVRSKVAGPFWVTLDLMFDSQENYERYSRSAALGADSIASIYGIDAKTVSLFPIPTLKVLKISYPRPVPQGGVEERDLHSGQQYAFLLDLELP
ncbi:DUF4387 domain-containing protein [Streptomyces sp. NPDC091272]|uniref:DUF4387 domain-containing protein n=1 Tax=Streptomyces sp. NPDC091272 TaxID=3365981 RepID=UPI0037F53530